MDMVLNLDDREFETTRNSEEYCCEKMKEAMECGKYGLSYDRQFAATFCIRRDEFCSWLWSFCPFCGKDISWKQEAYEKVLKNEFGITDLTDDEEKKLPDEFLTDEWWKKRGL